MEPVNIRSSTREKQIKVLFGLIDRYIATGKPVGSNTLKEAEFEDLSSATIRNYFSELEKEGYLEQLHTSGGRVPTEAAYRLYLENLEEAPLTEETERRIKETAASESKEIAALLQNSAEILSALTGCAVFLSAPRFDHDYITDIKLVPIDTTRCLCVLVTDFGVIRSELLPLEEKLTAFAAKRLEEYFHWRLSGHDKPSGMQKREEELAQRFYNELIVRYVVGYSNFAHEDIYRTGFSKLLAYPEFYDAASLAGSLALFEDAAAVRLLLRECQSKKALKWWIGKDLINYAPSKPNCAALAAPYTIGSQPVGAVGILGPQRLPYKELTAILKRFSEAVSETLTRNVYKFKISFRQPEQSRPFLPEQERKLLENKTEQP